MKKYRVNTTISQKHQKILKKHTEKYGTQQRTLENALEGLENNQNEDIGLPPDEQELWMRIGREIKDVFTLLQRDITKQLFETADLEKFKEHTQNEKPAEFAIEWYYNKPLRECTLHEIIEGIIIKVKIQGGADSVNFIEDEKYHTLNIAHSMGVNCSIIFVIMYESVFDTYGAQYETHFSERNVFFKIYK